MNMFPAVFPGIDYVTPTLVHTETVTDRYGNATKTVTETVMDTCLFEPEQSTERTDSRSPGVTTPAKLYCPPGVVPDADDKIRIDGKLWEIVGKPAVWGNVGVEIAIKRWGS